MVEFVKMPMEDFPLDHPAMERMAGVLGAGHPLVLPREPKAPQDTCYWSASRMVQKAGGYVALGWRITWLPGVYVMATHHGVWGDDEGLVDVTDDGSGLPGNTTFYLDDKLSVDLRWPVYITNRFVRLVDDPDVNAAINAYTSNNEYLRTFWAAVKKIPGAGWDGRYPILPFGAESRLPNVGPDLDRTFAELHRRNRVILARYFPEG